MRKAIATTLLAAAALAAPAAARTSLDAELGKLLAGRVAGEPTSCINLRTAQSSQIIDGKAIVYRVGDRLYVNQPRAGADSLDRDDVLVTRTFGSQLCRIDPVRLVDRATGFQRGFVILGDFVPYAKARPAG